MKNKKTVFLVILFTLLCSVVHAENAEVTKQNQLIIVNKSTNKMAFYDDGELRKVFSVATGKASTTTPEGTFTIIKKVKNMPYYKLKIPGGAPNNPLGPRWIGLSVPGTWGYTYGLHGNSDPNSIGTSASSGCVRMHNEEVTWLYDRVEMGTKVIIISSPLSFDDIAKANGYSLSEEKAVDSKLKVFISKNIPVYARASKYYSSVGLVNSHVVTVTKKYKNWFYIEDSGLNGWIKDSSIVKLNSIYSLTSSSSKIESSSVDKGNFRTFFSPMKI